ncbi:uncharacterized protein ARMOST_08456 [Armillaria ostoyae]|uniref:Uncharacterized protein n=1 Tax=Armillaria ostoyae TaxID=47428 RepID=A0A284R8Q1_ARMOS|nr:uncharacterized protein ARMOST_08456 [Armillaria ostoyae]
MCKPGKQELLDQDRAREEDIANRNYPGRAVAKQILQQKFGAQIATADRTCPPQPTFTDRRFPSALHLKNRENLGSSPPCVLYVVQSTVATKETSYIFY